MTQERLDLIKRNIQESKEQADHILSGGENYDGADGAREVRQVCSYSKELVAEIERLQHQINVLAP